MALRPEIFVRLWVEAVAWTVMSIAGLAAVFGSMLINFAVDGCIDDCAVQPAFTMGSAWRIALLLAFCVLVGGLAWAALRAERRGDRPMANRLLLGTVVIPVVIAVVWWFLVSIVH